MIKERETRQEQTPHKTTISQTQTPQKTDSNQAIIEEEEEKKSLKGKLLNCQLMPRRLKRTQTR